MDLKITLLHIQLQSGLITPIMEDTELDITFLEHGWIPHLHNRLRVMDGGIWIEGIWVPQPQREGDRSIMESFLCLGDVSKADLVKANACRLFLRVITLADISTMDGRSICAHSISGTMRAPSKLNWPEQPRPPIGAFDVFRWLLKRAFCLKPKMTKITNDIPLDVKLGKWLKTDRHCVYPLYINSEFRFL